MCHFVRQSVAATGAIVKDIERTLEFGHEQVPGFFVFRVFGVLAVGGEEDVGLVVGGGEGEDVEDVWGDYVGGEEVDLGWGVGGAVAVDDAAVGIFLAA